jgi:mono/diheme cytochrome c family protein
MRCVAILAAIIAALVLGVSAFVYFGVYDVSATVPHWGITEEVLEIVRERSIAVRSKGTAVPDLKEPGLLETGRVHYHAMCRLCHGAPVSTENELMKGLYPKPPSLPSGSVQRELGDAQLFWVIKHGLKMTAMPAFGPTHSDDELWGLVAYLKILPGLKAPAKKAEKEDHHSHTNTHFMGIWQRSHS